MQVLILSPKSRLLEPAILRAGDTPIIVPIDTKPEDWPEADFVVSFGYRTIIKGEVLKKYKGRMINIHTSVLPYNRGASPNFWSWFDNTPKGVSIHQINEGIDTGPLLAYHIMDEAEFRWGAMATLASTYSDLICCAAGLFNREWLNLRLPYWAIVSPYQLRVGSTHKAGEEGPFMDLLGSMTAGGYDVLASDITHMGRIYRGER